MNKYVIATLSTLSILIGSQVFANDNVQECKKLQDDYNVIYASKGFCFKDPEAKAKYGNDNCYTSKPKFSEKEQQRLDSIKERQKELNCK
ncbi:MAG: YARHG domain-containing protein [Acinetobacter sp.]